jgi:adenylosuccinate synthase
MINGVQELAVTKVDVLEGIPVMYSDKCIDDLGSGRYLPTSRKYKADLRQVKNVQQLVEEVIVKLNQVYGLDVKLKYLSTGKNRDEMSLF